MFFSQKCPFHGSFGNFFHWYLCRNRYTDCVEFENVMKSTHTKNGSKLLQSFVILPVTIKKSLAWYCFFKCSGKSIKIWNCLRLSLGVLTSPVLSHFFVFSRFFPDKVTRKKKSCPVPPIREVIASFVLSCLI